MKALKAISGILVIVGALNWGLVGAFKWNLVTAIFGSMPAVENTVYVLVGIAAIVVLVLRRRENRSTGPAM